MFPDNQSYLKAIFLAKRLMSYDLREQESTWKNIWSKRTYRRWIPILSQLMSILVQEYQVEGAVVVQRWVHALAKQRTTPEGDPGYLGLALALRSLSQITHTAAWKENKGEETEREVVAIWVHELQKAALTHLLEQPVALVSLVRDVQHLSRPARTFAAELLLDLLLQPENRHLHETLLSALEALHADISTQRLLVAQQDGEAEVQQALQYLFSLKKQEISTELSELKGDENELHTMQRTPIEENSLDNLEKEGSFEDIRALLGNDDEQKRQSAIKMLIQREDAATTQALLAMLTTSEERVHQAVIQILSVQERDALLPHLLYGLNSQSWQGREAIMSIIRAWGEQAVEETLTFLSRDAQAIVRVAAVHLLATLEDEAPIDVLTQVLKDDDWRVRIADARALCDLGERVPIEPLLTALQDSSEQVRWAASQAIGKRDNDGKHLTIELLASDLDVHSSAHTRMVVYRLGLLGKHAPLEPLYEALQDADLSVRLEAAQALDQAGEPVPIDLLLEALHAEGWHERFQAATLIGRKKEHAPLDALVAFLAAENVCTRMGAVQALGMLGEIAPLAPLLAALHDEHSGVREEAVRALGTRGERIPVEALVSTLRDEDVQVRRTAAHTLGKAKRQETVEPLMELIKDREWEVREAALSTLHELREYVPLEFFLQALNDDMYLNRDIAMGTVAEQAEQVPMDLFVNALRDNADEIEALQEQNIGHTNYVRAGAARALGTYSANAPVELLVAALNDRDEVVRREAVGALGTLGVYVPLEPILTVLGDDHPWVRFAALEALKQQNKSGKWVPLEPLLNALGDSAESIRAIALQVLRQQHPEKLKEIIPELVAITRGQQESTLLASLSQGHLAESLGAIGFSSLNVIERLSHLLDWPFWEVRMKAVQALGTLHSLPDETLRRLLELRHDTESRAVRRAANDTLDNVLSLETCIQDEEAVE